MKGLKPASDTFIGRLFSRIAPGSSYAAFPWRSWDKVCTILETIRGRGCRIKRSHKDNEWEIDATDGLDKPHAYSVYVLNPDTATDRAEELPPVMMENIGDNDPTVYCYMPCPPDGEDDVAGVNGQNLTGTIGDVADEEWPEGSHWGWKKIGVLESDDPMVVYGTVSGATFVDITLDTESNFSDDVDSGALSGAVPIAWINGANVVQTLCGRPWQPSRILPFDVRVAPGGEGHEDETHAYCYVPDSAPLVVACNGALSPLLQILSGQALDSSTGWLDCGEVSPGQYVVLSGIVTTTAFSRYGHAAPLYTDAKYCLSISDYPGIAQAPTGYELAYILIPQLSIAQCGPNGIRQLFHGVYRTEAAFGDDSLTGTAWTSSEIRTLSIANEDYKGYPGVVSVHGFRQPTTISNPYNDDGTPPSSPDEYLVLVRVLSADGKTAEMKYLPLGLLAAGDGSGGGGHTPPQEIQDVIDDYDARIAIPCPWDQQTPSAERYNGIVVWDTCAGEWVDITQNADALRSIVHTLATKFWPLGGSRTTCYGSEIGDSSKDLAIDLDYRSLVGAWTASGPNQGQSGNALYVDGNFEQSNGSFSVGNTSYVGVDLVINGEKYRFLANDMGPV